METYSGPLTKKNLKNIRQVRELLSTRDTFAWEKTSSGGDYWMQVNDKLVDLLSQKRCDKCGQVLGK